MVYTELGELINKSPQLKQIREKNYMKFLIELNLLDQKNKSVTKKMEDYSQEINHYTKYQKKCFLCKERFTTKLKNKVICNECSTLQ